MEDTGKKRYGLYKTEWEIIDDLGGLEKRKETFVKESEKLVDLKKLIASDTEVVNLGNVLFFEIVDKEKADVIYTVIKPKGVV